MAGKTKPKCSLASEIERYDPSEPGAAIECFKCPECPEGLGLSPQCGARVTKDTRIECKPCVANITYSDSHGIGSCKSCPECGLKNVIQHCTPKQMRICGTECPQGHFLDHNNICQQCYFCCDNVPESGRRQGCKKIGMDRNWQCEKTEQNQHCKEALDTTPKPTDAKPAAILHDDKPTRSTMFTKKNLKTEVYEANTSQNLLIADASTTMGSSPGTREMEKLPANDDSTSGGLSKNDNGSLRVAVGVVSIIVIIPLVALLSSEKGKKFIKFLRQKKSKLAGNYKD